MKFSDRMLAAHIGYATSKIGDARPRRRTASTAWSLVLIAAAAALLAWGLSIPPSP